MTIEDLALIFTRGIGSRGAAHLVDYFGSAKGVYTASRSELIEGAHLRPELAERILKREGMREGVLEAQYCQRHDIRLIAATDKEYPTPLREVPDRPHVLFVQGNVDALHKRTLAVVGTREISPSGHHVTDKLISDLAQSVDDLCIVSGLAFGVDGAAHRSALNNGVTTVGVVADILPNVSPASHRALAESILENGGALLSELHSRTKQRGNLYIARNRIIAGLSYGTVVVESPASGGSLYTAEIADSYGRMVMAVPGRLTDSNSFGSNNLIRSGKARLILSVRDIMEDMGWECREQTLAAVEQEDDDLTPPQRMIISAFDQAPVLDHAGLIKATGLKIGELAMEIMELELKGRIRTLPGQCFERV